MPRAAPEPASSRAGDALRPVNPLVSRTWLLGGVLGAMLATLVLGYGCLLLLYWQGQWQFLFHPSHVVRATPASVGLAFQDVRFDATETGQPLLDGWWIPASGNPGASTALYLHGATGSLADALPDLAALHAAGLNVFAFDYRGYGQSAWAPPSERRWNEDAAAAWNYLVGTRHVAPSSILLCGAGYGAAVAAHLAAAYPQVRALVLEDPQPPAIEALERDDRSRYVPVRLLAHDHFDPSAALASSHVPKLFIGTQQPMPYAAAAGAPKAVLQEDVAAGSLLGTPQAQAAVRGLIGDPGSRAAGSAR